MIIRRILLRIKFTLECDSLSFDNDNQAKPKQNGTPLNNI